MVGEWRERGCRSRLKDVPSLLVVGFAHSCLELGLDLVSKRGVKAHLQHNRLFFGNIRYCHPLFSLITFVLYTPLEQYSRNEIVEIAIHIMRLVSRLGMRIQL